ncbi:MAG: type IV pili methyl-accepting chemotaxis transducer N-terminal domain-containing protein [Rhodocyclales bacterium]|nr:type IV pili methyl-accepting chemotaxis transducer N-terminal domain-containing protein [Rhodocyclales bacterium]
MKNALAAALLVCTLLAPVAQGAPAAAPGITQDIANAGELRLQSQRLAKLWLQTGLGIHAGAASRHLADGVGRFERSLGGLGHHARNENTHRIVHRIAELWGEYRLLLLLPYGTANLEAVNRLADELMLATGRLSARIEADAEGATARLLDLSLRQNMLVQRLARLTLMAQTGDRSRGRLVDIEQARREFASALNELATARENTPANREALELARVQWMFFDRAIVDIGKHDSRPEHVATTSERIREVLDAVSRQYAAEQPDTRLATAGTPPRRN